MDNGEDGSDEGDDGDKEGEREGGLLAISLTPAGEEEAAGLLLKPDAGVKSMGQEDWSCRGQTVEPGGWKQRGEATPKEWNPAINLQSSNVQSQTEASVLIYWYLFLRHEIAC